MGVYEVPALNQVEQKRYIYTAAAVFWGATTETRATVTDALATGFNLAKTKTQRRGEKVYELSNHMVNVLATITDKKLQKGKPAPLEGELAYIEADALTATDYYR